MLVINDADSPPDLHFLSPLNFPASAMAPLRSLNWAQLELDWSSRETRELSQYLGQPENVLGQAAPEPQQVTTPATTSSQPVAPPTTLPLNEGPLSGPDGPPLEAPSLNKARKESSRFNKKRERHREVMETRQQLFDGHFEG